MNESWMNHNICPFFRNRFRSWSSDVRLDNKTVIITGANTGIGKHAATDLAKRGCQIEFHASLQKWQIRLSYYSVLVALSSGARIIMACRDMEKANAALKEVIEASGNQNVVTSRLDLADTKSIREFAEKINTGEIFS